MPSIAQAVAKNQARIAAGIPSEPTPAPTPQNLVQIASPPIAIPPAGGGLPQRGQFPADLVLASDLQLEAPGWRGVGMRSGTFPYPTPSNISPVNPFSGINESSSTTEEAVSLLLQTNGQTNVIQTKLNLQQGSNVTITADGAGNVVISSANSGGDGLVHGETPWETDPSYISYRDDFYLGSGSPSTGGVSTVGDLRWDYLLGSGAASYRVSGYAPHWGQIRIDSGASASTNSCLFSPLGSASSATSPGGGCFQSAFPFMDYPGWKMVWIFGFPISRASGTASPFPLTKSSFYCGLCTSSGSVSGTFIPNTTNGRPPYFIGLRFDTDTTSPSIGDSTFKFESVSNLNLGNTRNNTQGTVYDTGIVPTENVYYRFEMVCIASGQITMTLTPDNGTSFSQLVAASTMSAAGNVGSASYGLSIQNGIYEITQTAAATSLTSNPVWAIGSKVAVTNATNSALDQNLVIGGDVVTGHWIVYVGGSASVTENSSPAIQTGYPGLIPYFSFGNDTESSPVTKSVSIDFWSVVINGGLTGASANPVLSRYF